jgi:hypothetical protein
MPVKTLVKTRDGSMPKFARGINLGNPVLKYFIGSCIKTQSLHAGDHAKLVTAGLALALVT